MKKGSSPYPSESEASVSDQLARFLEAASFFDFGLLRRRDLLELPILKELYKFKF